MFFSSKYYKIITKIFIQFIIYFHNTTMSETKGIKEDIACISITSSRFSCDIGSKLAKKNCATMIHQKCEQQTGLLCLSSLLLFDCTEHRLKQCDNEWKKSCHVTLNSHRFFLSQSITTVLTLNFKTCVKYWRKMWSDMLNWWHNREWDCGVYVNRW